VDNIRKLVKALDLETPKGQGNINVYYLEHATAEDVAKVLQDIPQKGSEPTEGGKRTAPIVSEKVRIAADKATNSLIITADLEDYMVLESIIKKIDIPRAMVYIEALIMEVNVSKNFELGTEWLIGGQSSYKDKEFIYGGGYKNGSDLPIIGYAPAGDELVPQPTRPGLSLGLFGEALTISGIQFPSITAIITAYKRDNDVHILSTPQILTTDNQEAKIYVGKNIPFQTQAATSTSTVGEVYNSYEYKDVGKTLKITPQISKDRMVRLNLSLEISSLESGVTNDRPTTLKRTIDTTAIVKDGGSVVLGGLIDDSGGQTVYKTPCLGDIPGLGFLFSNRANSFEKNNLYIFLTPRVIQTPEEAQRVSSYKKNEITRIKEKNINLYDSDKEIPPEEELQLPGPQPGNDAPDSRSQPMTPSSSDQPQGMEESAAPGATSAASSSPGAISGQAPAEDSSTYEEATAFVPSPDEDVSESGGDVEGYTLQVASVKLAEKANELLQSLTSKGYAAYTVRSEVNGAIWYRVRIGYFIDKPSAEPVIDQLENDRFSPILIKL